MPERNTSMSNRRAGLWLVGAFGGVASTAALGLAALRRGLTDTTSVVTALPLFAGVDLDDPGQFVVGGHEIRQTSYAQAVRELHQRSNVFEPSLVDACLPQLEEWSANVRPGTILNAGTTIAKLADLPKVRQPETDALPSNVFGPICWRFRRNSTLNSW